MFSKEPQSSELPVKDFLCVSGSKQKKDGACNWVI